MPEVHNAPALAAAATLDAQQSVRYPQGQCLHLRSGSGTHRPAGQLRRRRTRTGRTAVAADLPYSGPLSSYSPSIAAAVSTGAFLTPGLPSLKLTDTEAPSLMFMYGYDTASHITAAYAFETCDALRAAGNACYEVEQSRHRAHDYAHRRRVLVDERARPVPLGPAPTVDRRPLKIAASSSPPPVTPRPRAWSRRTTTMSATFADDSA